MMLHNSQKIAHNPLFSQQQMRHQCYQQQQAGKRLPSPDHPVPSHPSHTLSSLLSILCCHSVPNYYRNIILSYLDQPTHTIPAQQHVLLTELALISQSTALYIPIQQYHESGVRGIAKLKLIVTQMNTDYKEGFRKLDLTAVCMVLDYLRRDCLGMCEAIAALLRKYQQRLNQEILGLLEPWYELRRILRRSCLRYFIPSGEGVDPLLVKSMEIWNREGPAEYDQEVNRLFGVGVSYMYRLIKAQRFIVEGQIEQIESIGCKIRTELTDRAQTQLFQPQNTFKKSDNSHPIPASTRPYILEITDQGDSQKNHNFKEERQEEPQIMGAVRSDVVVQSARKSYKKHRQRIKQKMRKDQATATEPGRQRNTLLDSSLVKTVTEGTQTMRQVAPEVPAKTTQSVLNKQESCNYGIQVEQFKDDTEGNLPSNRNLSRADVKSQKKKHSRSVEPLHSPVQQRKFSHRIIRQNRPSPQFCHKPQGLHLTEFERIIASITQKYQRLTQEEIEKELGRQSRNGSIMTSRAKRKSLRVPFKV